MNWATTRYYSTAFILSFVWYAALLIPPMMRKVLGQSLELKIPEAILLLAVTSLAVAFIFRRQIISARGKKNLVLGITVPFAATFIFIVFMLIYKGLLKRLGGGDIGASLFYGPVFVLQSFYVVVPMGLFSQYIMRKAGA